MLINRNWAACGSIFGDDCLFRAVSCAEKQYFVCGLTGTLGMAGVFAGKSQVFQYILPVLRQLVVIVFCARLFAVWRKVPSNVFMISGIFPIVPGIGIYNTIYDIMIGDAAAAMTQRFGDV
ncbi:MAG: threonine/serine exporter family protein [Eubacterium ramulus]